MTMWKYQNIKISCRRLYSKLVWRRFMTKKVKTTVPWTFVIENINVEDIGGMLYEKKIVKNKSNIV